MDPGDNQTVQITPADRDIAIRTMLGEEGAPEAQAGVASVILNRAQSGKYGGNTLSGVALAPGQFEPWSTHAKDLEAIQPNDPSYQKAGKIFDSVASGETPDFTNGATHFYAPAAQKALGRPAPQWASGAGTSLGQTLFYSPQGAVHYKAPAAQAIQVATSDQGKKSNGAEPDIVDQYLKPMPSATPAAAAAPAKTAAPASSSNQPDLIDQYLKPMPNAVPAHGAAPGSYPLGDPRNKGQVPASYTDNTVIPATGAPDAPYRADAVDPSAPLSQNLKTAAGQAGNYIADQVRGVPAAIGNAFEGGTQAAALGRQEMAQGNYLPTMTQPGGILTNVGGHIAQLAAPLTGVTNQFVTDPVTRATGSPAIGENAGVVANSLVGPVLGPAARMIPSNLAAKVVGDISPETAALAQTARNQFGIPVNAGQMSSSPAVRFANSVVGKLPFSGAGPAREVTQTAFNNAVSNTFGESADKITPAVMSRAKSRIGGELDNIQANSSTRIDPQFVTDIHGTLNDAQSVLPPDEVRSLRNQVGKIYDVIDPRTGTISGESYQALTRQGAPLSQLQSSSNPNTAHYAGQLRDALDDAMERSAPPGVADRLREARSQYKSMKTIEDLAAKSPDGDISPASLMQKVSSKFSTLPYGGGGDLGDLARIGQKFLKEPPSSGTAERFSMMGMGKTLGSAGMGLFGLHEVAPGLLPAVGENAGLAAASVPAALALGRATGAGLRSNWLANNMINRSLGRGPTLAPQTTAGAVIPSGGAGIGSYVSNRFAQPDQPQQ